MEVIKIIMNRTILQRIEKENYITHKWTPTSGYLTPDGRWVHLIPKEDEEDKTQHQDRIQ